MKSLVLTPSRDGELKVWEKPRENAEYIVSCDPSLGRTGIDGDHSAVGVWRREPGRRIVQVASWYARWTAGRVGEVVACLGKASGGWDDKSGAIINIERNLSDAPLYALKREQYPDAMLFVPPEQRNVAAGYQRLYFTQKHGSNQRALLDYLIDYMERDAIVIKDRPTLDQLRGLMRDQRGDVNTKGRDLAVMVMMACAADKDSDAVTDNEFKPPAPEEAPYGVDPVRWAQKQGWKKEPEWDFAAPEWEAASRHWGWGS